LSFNGIGIGVIGIGVGFLVRPVVFQPSI